jgi:hypothetical protein
MKTPDAKREYDRLWRLANPEKVKAHDRAREVRDKEKRALKKPLFKARRAAYVEAHPGEFQGPPRSLRATAPKPEGDKREVKNAARRRYYAKNKHKARAKDAQREASKAQRTPQWFGEFDAFIAAEAYALLPLRKEATGIDWHVDHMLPLRGKTVSGLHVGGNLAVIPATVNVRKAEKMICTETGDWLRHVA